MTQAPALHKKAAKRLSKMGIMLRDLRLPPHHPKANLYHLRMLDDVERSNHKMGVEIMPQNDLNLTPSSKLTPKFTLSDSNNNDGPYVYDSNLVGTLNSASTIDQKSRESIIKDNETTDLYAMVDGQDFMDNFNSSIFLSTPSN